MARALGTVRLSHDTDASTSVERQTEAITAWAKSHGHTVVKITTDPDISGATAPQDRPDLGEWLTNDTRVGQWDILVVAKLDRLSRSLIDFSTLLQWCQERGKVIVSVAESLDFGTPTGKFIGQILILFAEFERQMMRERRADAARKIYDNGSYNGGGSLPWGYRVVRTKGHIELEPDGTLKSLIEDIAGSVLGGESVKSVADRHGLDHASLLRRLKSPSLKGVVTFHGEIVRDADGLPKLREPIVSAKRWVRLQAKLEANSKGAGVSRNASAWLHVIKCKKCGQDLYRQHSSDRPGRVYYRHKRLKRYAREKIQVCIVNVDGNSLEQQIAPLVLTSFGDSYIPEVIEIPGEDHTEELAAIDEAIAAWEAKAISGEAPDSCIRILDALQRKRDVLAALPEKPARKEVIMSADRFSDHWSSLGSDHERGELLRRIGVCLYATRDAKGRVKLILWQNRPGEREHDPWAPLSA